MAFTAEQWILVIGAITTLICSVIAALKTVAVKATIDDHSKQLTAQDHVLQKVDQQTNGNLSSLRAENAQLRAELVELKSRESAAVAIGNEVRRQLLAPERRVTATRRRSVPSPRSHR